jgi:hypothetical protein
MLLPWKRCFSNGNRACSLAVHVLSRNLVSPIPPA